MRADFKLTEYRRNALIRSLGPLDPILERAGLGVGDQAALLAYEIGRFGEPITPFDVTEEPVAALICNWVFPNGRYALAGILESDPNQEFSVIKAIDELSAKQLAQSRTQIRYFSFALCCSLFP
jgi:hypothetical protein